MRTFRKVIRAIAGIVYCGLGLIGCVVLLGLLVSFFAGAPVPWLGVFAHGEWPVPSKLSFLLVINGILLVIVCDLYFRAAKQYRHDEEDS